MTTTNNNATATASIGFPIFGLSFLVLLVFKLAGMAGASWGLASLSWFWVFFPLMLGFTLTVTFLVAVVLVAAWASK